MRMMLTKQTWTQTRKKKWLVNRNEHKLWNDGWTIRLECIYIQREYNIRAITKTTFNWNILFLRWTIESGRRRVNFDYHIRYFTNISNHQMTFIHHTYEVLVDVFIVVSVCVTCIHELSMYSLYSLHVIHSKCMPWEMWQIYLSWSHSHWFV